MKKFILLFVISLCMNTFVNAQTWRKAFDTPVNSVLGGYMIDGNTAFLVGYSQNIYKSTDGGITWVNKSNFDISAINFYDINDICFVNSTTGFAGAYHGRLFKTTNGGESWQTLLIPDTTYSIIKLHFFDANLGFTLCNTGSSSIIYKTTDGGNTWITAATIAAAMEAMDFYSPTTGIATGNTGALYYTTDGATWNIAPNPTLPPISYSRSDQWSVKFISPTTAVSCGWGSIALGFQPTIFLKTTNAGATWTCLSQADQNKTYVNLYSQYFKDSLNGIAVGGTLYPGTVICRTTDGGTNWVPLPTIAGFTAQIVMGYDNKIIISGGSGSILLSTDFGDSWVAVNKHPRDEVDAVDIINNNIYTCGRSGIFFKSTDNGANFDLSYITAGNKSLWSKAVQFLNENLGFAVSQHGQVVKTTDAGSSWTQVIRDTTTISCNNQALYFINENIGFVVGYVASNVDVIYKTTDGGQSWSSVQNKAYQNLNCVGFADDIHGAAGGNNSAMLYTTDQGVTWQKAAVNIPGQLNINAIKFYNGLNGIAVGASIILKTTDGGATWNPVGYSTNINLTSVCYSDTALYTAGGMYCLKSTDDGNTWQNIMDTVFAVQNGINYLYSVAVDKSGFLWLGSYGIITNSPVTGIIKDVVEPLSFKLEQNYPNPFNPSTTINFTINTHGLVTLKLFDILGREVRLIYKGDMTAGQHKINFNAGNLASGTYIYSLQANDQFTCRKMTLLK